MQGVQRARVPGGSGLLCDGSLAWLRILSYPGAVPEFRGLQGDRMSKRQAEGKAKQGNGGQKQSGCGKKHAACPGVAARLVGTCS